MSLKSLWPVVNQFQNKNGSILTAGKVYVYYKNRTTLAEIFSDEEGTVVRPNPIFLDNNGRATVFADTAYSYTIVVCDYYGKELFSQDITLHDVTESADEITLIGSDGSIHIDTSSSNGVKTFDMSANTDILATKKSVDDLDVSVKKNEDDIKVISGNVENIATEMSGKKDKQSELTFNGSATKTVKKITQYPNGEMNVEFEDIDLPQEVPNVEITSEDNSVKVTETTDTQTNTKKFDLSVNVDDKIPDPSTSNPLMDGTAAVGVSTKYAREDHVHPSDTSKESVSNKTTVVLGTSNSKYPTDKAVADFVNSSVATNTANYISNNGEPFTSVEELEAYTGTVTNNDYAFVTGTDSAGNTYYDRYKATVDGSTVTWALEYRLNNSSFTAAQWAAINSGVTSDKANYWDGKQDALTFDGTYNGSTNKAATVATVTNAINALDVSNISGFGTGKTLATLKEENGKISATFQNISIAKSQVSDFSHTHGNIQNGGTLQTNDITIANGDKLVVTDASDSNKVARASLTFDGATTDQMLSKKGEWSDTIAKARAVVDYGSPSNAIEIGWAGDSVNSPTHFAVYTNSEHGYKAIKDCSLDNAKKAINGTSVGSTAVPIFINANGAPQVCTDDFMHDGDTVESFTGYNTSNIVAGSWYIIALKRGGDSEWERLYEFLISSNDNSAEQMRVLFSPRITGTGGFSDSKVFISGHIMLNTSLLANWKFATLKDTAGTTYTALCVNGSSNKSRSVYWNVRSVRGKNDWNPVSINLNTNKEYTIISELPFNSSNSLPNCITTNTISPAISGNVFNSSLPITSGATFNYLTQNTCNPSKPIILSSGGTNITSTGGSWTSAWRQIDCQLSGNGMLDVTASFGINIINQHTYVQLLTSGTCNICDWSGNVVKAASFSMPKHINNSLIYTVTDNISMRFVIPNCESKFANGLKVIITLPSNYTIDDQVNIANFTLTGTYWRNGTGYNSNVITFDS